MNTQSQKQMAKFLGISPQYISDIKNKRRTLGKKAALRISRKIGLPFQDVIFLDGEEFVKRVQIAMMVDPKKREAKS
ncbi:helix-turn-helix domain-containing protein [Desulfobulbus sp.]|uniref:helix-turn-helix transcriptional regulator n=1 Tax=Desulfobulbus sp. TaxID=895 RepID=UPI00286F8DA5|nr:helix-turn-helix domain-containing protein [Desulfobulbus sp.]